MEKGRILTGARCIFSLEGKKVGYARNVTVGEDIDYEDLEVLGNIEVEEIVPIGYRVRLSASLFRIFGKTLKSEGFFPPTGKDVKEHLQNILLSGELTATIEDIKNNRIWSQVEQVKIASHNWTVDARGIVGEDVEFRAVRARDESEIT